MAATERTRFTRTLDLSVEEVYRVASSERYLCTIDTSNASTDVARSSRVLASRRWIDDDGTVRAELTVAPDAAHAPQDPDGSGPVDLGITQESRVTPPATDGSFTMVGATPLPRTMGVVVTTIDVSPTDAGTAHLDCEVEATCTVPIVAGRLAAQLIGGAEQSVDRGLERIRTLAQD